MTIELDRAEVALCMTGLMVMQGLGRDQPDPEPPAIEILISRLEGSLERPDPDRNKTTTGATHPQTSHRSALGAYPNTGTQRRKVLDYIESRGPVGTTDEQLRKALMIPFGSALARRNELVTDGWVIDSGMTATTDAGGTAIIWRSARWPQE